MYKLKNSTMSSKAYYVYFLYDSEDNLLYIGKSTSLINRLRQHFSKEDITKYPWKESINKNNVVVYKCENEADLDIYETYFINKYKPIYNQGKVYKNLTTFELPYLEPMVLLQKEEGLKSLYNKGNEKEKQSLIQYVKHNPNYICTDVDFAYYLLVKNKLNT